MNFDKHYFESLQKTKKSDIEVLLKQAYRGIWETAIKKYSDSAHFVYELLQNADDAQATWVEFDIENDGLWFKHNGTVRFTISNPKKEDDDTNAGTLGHINAITSIGNSAKIDDQKIGKFGIGFKAVFAYSNTPHIYDDTFNFKLENYIVPIEIEDNTQRRKEGETLFYFPFNTLTKAKEEAYEEIQEKLETLFQPILFLIHLKKIKWASIDKNGEYIKKPLKSETYGRIKASLIEVSRIEGNVPNKEYIWLFTSAVVHETMKSSHRIAVGFFVVDKNKLEIGFSYDAFCFFPTKEETKLGFIIQAPFWLTDSREGIKAGDKWNNELVKQLADLAAQSINILKEIGVKERTYLVNDSILELIPYNEADYSEVNSKGKISFKPFYHAILKKFETEKLLPGLNGNYYITQKAYWATDPELPELFTDKQVSALMENRNSGWVFVTKGQKQLNQANKALEVYINRITKETLDPKKLLRKITAEFIEDQSDEWLVKFYAYLGGRKFLWDDRDKLALKRPILLNQDRKAVVPFDDDQTAPLIFLPTDRKTSYDTIYKPFIENKDTLDFFKSLGIREPDLQAEIFRSIIPQYDDETIFEDKEIILKHFESFLNYYETCSLSAIDDFINKLREISFVASKTPTMAVERYFCKPEEVYFYKEKLVDYFWDNTQINVLDEEFYLEIINSKKKEKFYNFLVKLGVSSFPKIKEVELEDTYDNKERFALENYDISQKYRSVSIIDKVLEGLEEAVAKITLDVSVSIWKYLLYHLEGMNIRNATNYLSGEYKFVPKWNSYYKTEPFDSTLISIIKNEKWLFDKEGNKDYAKNLKRETINDNYNLDDASVDVLLEILEIDNPYAELDLTEDQKEALNIGRKLLQEGVTKSEIDEFLSMLSARKRAIITKKDEIDKEEIEVEEKEIDQMISKLRKGITKKRLTEKAVKEDLVEPNLIKFDENIENQADDQDEFSKPSIDLQKKIDRLKEQTEAQIEDLTRIEKLYDIVKEKDKYSFAWYKALLELEYLSSSETNTQGKEISIQFTKVEKEPGTERTLILKHPNRYIPQSIEDIGDLQVKLFHGDETKTVTVEVVSVKEYTLRAKLKKTVDLENIDLSKVSRVVIDVKNPVFILEELRKSFYKLDFEDDFNLQHNLTKSIKFIFGPPGTGKTTYLASDEIIPLMKKKENLKVLVLAPTNKSADVLTKRVIEKMGDDESYYNWLFRFGNTADPDLENSGLVIDKSFDITKRPKNTVLTTIARFAYDYFQPEIHEERLHLKFLHWDYIIIDEASMVTLASISYILYQKPEASFIIAGDPFQIQPITQIEEWKDMNIYDLVQLDKFVNPITVPHQFEIVNLQKQYRAIPTIGQVFSHFTYEGILEHHRSKEDQKVLNIKGLDFKDINIIKFPVSKFESIYKPNTLNKSNYQVYSALFTVEFVKNLVVQIDRSHKDKFRIGVICPYKAQATLIEKLLSQQLIESDNAEVIIGTIHGFQGDECDIIISVFNPPFSISKHPGMFLNKQNILNVSISRARDYLFILMPDELTKDVVNLYRINKIEKLIIKHAIDRYSIYSSEAIEEQMFGGKSFIDENSFATTHQSVNVYSKPERKYEVRCEEFAIDVQIGTQNL